MLKNSKEYVSKIKKYIEKEINGTSRAKKKIEI